MAEEQQLASPASQPTESQVVVAKELEIQAAPVNLANNQMQLHSVAHSKGKLQEVHGPSCSPTQANQDELAAVTDIPTLWGCSFHAQSSCDISPSGQSPEEVANPGAKQIDELKQMVLLIQLELAAEHEQKQAAKAAWQDEVKQKVSLQAALQKEQAALQKEVEQSTLQQAALQNVRAAKTARATSQAVAKALLSLLAPCTSVHHDLEISVSDEDEICIPSHAALPDQRDITSSWATKVAQCHFHSAQAPASDMGYKHSTQHDIKSHPSDEVDLKSPHSSIYTVSPKNPLSVDKLVRVQSMSSPHNLCTTLDTDEEEECLLCIGDRHQDEKSVHKYMAVPQITQDSMNQSPSNAQSPSSSRSLVIPVSHDENVHHVDPQNPYRVPPPTSRAKLSPTTEKLYDPVDPGITA